MPVRIPLLAKVLGWLSLHLVLLGVTFFLFVRWQLGLGLESLLSGSAGARLAEFGDNVAEQVAGLPVRQWNEVIGPLAEAKGLAGAVYDPSGGPPMPFQVPPPVRERARMAVPQRLAPPPPAPPRPEFDRPPGDPGPGFGGPDAGRPPGPDGPGRRPPAGEMRPQPNDGDGLSNTPGVARSRPVFLMAAGRGGGYWAGVMLHAGAVRNRPGQPVLLLLRSDRPDGSGMFFDYRPWLWGGLAVLLLSLAFWTPFVWRITAYLRRLTHAADGIAAGRFHVSLPPRGGDELGNLGRTIESMAKRLEQLIAGQKRFLGDAAHELCAPLARIRTGLGILEMKLTDADLAALESIDADTAELAALVDEILTFSRAGNRTPKLATVAIEPLVREIVAREAGDDVVDVVVPHGLAWVADPMLLGRALGNLIRNAFIHAGPHAKVAVRVSEAADHLDLTVRDDGPGVPREELSHLFEPFYRIDRSRSRDTGGSGLGLAIVRTAMETCGGRAVAWLPDGGGFAVTLRLPKRSAADVDKAFGVAESLPIA